MLIARRPQLSFENTKRWWMAGSAAPTHIGNALSIFVPASERFGVRAIHKFASRVSPALAADARGLFAQEGRHANAHDRFLEKLRADGLEIDALVQLIERILSGVERHAPPLVCLSVTVAFEEFAALLSAQVLTEGGMPFQDEEMRKLFEWHAAEELEHRSVAFDVLREVAPSYLLRIFGLAIAATSLGGFWLWATRALCAQEGMSLLDVARELKSLKEEAARTGGPTLKPIATGVFLRGIVEYLKPGFHPSHRDQDELVATTLVNLAREGVIPADAAA